LIDDGSSLRVSDKLTVGVEFLFQTIFRTKGGEMPFPLRSFKLSGMVPKDDILHKDVAIDDEEIAPIYVEVPGGRKVPQYAKTVVGKSLTFDPANDCNGNFASGKHQVNNNCYNYACNIATNSFAQPGRLHGFFLELEGGPTGPVIVKGAQKDGLIHVAGANLKLADLRKRVVHSGRGHLVALLISRPKPAVGWGGDYHWVRCDNLRRFSWSQKDGTDQVTNFDFRGSKIKDPREAIWVVNQGQLLKGDPRDIIVHYNFFCFMFVPAGKVDII
jgi:hypothetical protein